MEFITEKEAQAARERAKNARLLALGLNPIWEARQEVSRQFVNVHTGKPNTYNKAFWDYVNLRYDEALRQRREDHTIGA